MSYAPEIIDKGLKHLRSADPVMQRLIEQVGAFRLKLNRNRFDSLVRSIISQQISGSAARSINARLRQELAPERLVPGNLVRLTPVKFRSAGVSPQKSAYLRDLAQKVIEGSVRLHRVARMSDQEVIEELIQIKGIGVWTAQMFLIFSLGRLDVFPQDDLGIRVALRNLYGLGELPDKATSQRLAAPWRPYATLASWYCWRSLDLKKNSKAEPETAFSLKAKTGLQRASNASTLRRPAA
jgi:DNA-3-methyladenine glycosylase II